ncbi:MAG: hypothetical protein AB1696_03500 [Planctomycetota bacterium]
MNRHSRHEGNPIVARSMQAEKERKTAEAHEYYRRLVRTKASYRVNSRRDNPMPEPRPGEAEEMERCRKKRAKDHDREMAALCMDHYHQLVQRSTPTPPSKNARTHGLTTEVLAVDRRGYVALNALLDQLRAEYQPTGPTEDLLVRDLWRHACFLHLCAQAEIGHFRHIIGVRIRCDAFISEKAITPDFLHARAAGDDRLALITRYRRTHERGFLDVQRRLMELRAYRDAQARIGPPILPATALPAVDARTRDALLQRFSREEDCIEHILAHRERGDGPACPRCRKKPMRWEDDRRLWRCGRCGGQMTVLWGTVMARSRLPLTLWFAAAVVLMFEPDLSVLELQSRLDLPRQATASDLRSRILRRLPPLGAPEERLKTCLFVN